MKFASTSWIGVTVLVKIMLVGVMGPSLFGNAFLNTFSVFSGTPFSSPSQILSSLLLPRYQRKGSHLRQQSISSLQPFNPFTLRNPNSNKKWYDSDSLDLFYHYISHQPLLNAKQEYQLGRAIQFWNRLENVRESLRRKYGDKNSSAVSDEDLATYIGCNPEEITKMKKYYELSKRKLLISNLKLVLAVVSRYRTSSISNAELIMQGAWGLSQAVMRYDYSRGFRFSTYATWYVHQAVSFYVRAKKATIQFPNRQLVLLRKVKQYMSEFASKSGNNPSVSEISEALNVPRYEIMRVLSRRLHPTRLDDPAFRFGKDGDKERQNTLETVTPSFATPPTESFTAEFLKDYVESILSGNLTPAEKEIVRSRLGLSEGREVPLKEVGRKYKLSWKKVQQLEEDAWGKLQSIEIDPETAARVFTQQEALQSSS